jgi:ferredoxin-type protein NapF
MSLCTNAINRFIHSENDLRDLARRRFVRGQIGVATSPSRPPWAVSEEEFARRCTRCAACSDVCPTRIITCGDGGYPEVDFARGECTFCGECVIACRDGALRRAEGGVPWLIKAEIGTACLALNQVECRVCGERCATRAIRFRLQAGGVATPLLDPDACNGCGACVAGCPASAISLREPLPTAAAA